MTVLRFYGGSDDIFGQYETYSQEIDCFDKDAIFQVTNPEGDGVLVTGRYGKHNATWTIAVTPYSFINQDEPQIPESFKIRLESGLAGECAYSPTLVIEAEGTLIVKPFEEE